MDDLVIIADPIQRRILFGTDTDSLVAIFGGPGDGPGEFRLPVLAARCKDEIAIFDPLLQRITMVARSGVLTGTMQLTEPVRGPSGMACTPRGTVVISGYVQGEGGAESYLLHEYDVNGVRLRSFGRREPVFRDPVDAQLADGGPLVADPQTGRMWFARSGPVATLLVYDSNGALWRRFELKTKPAISWSSRYAIPRRGSGSEFVPRARLGSIRLFVLGRDRVLVVSRLSDDGTVRYDVIEGEEVIVSWVEKHAPGRARILGVGMDGKALVGPTDGSGPVSVGHLALEQQQPE